MNKYFDALQQIEIVRFFEDFRQHKDSRQSLDVHESQIYQELEEAQACAYCFAGILNAMGLENVILPQHDHCIESGREPDRPTKPGGERLTRVAGDFRERFIPGQRFLACTRKIQEQQARFFDSSDSVLEADFLFVCNHREYAHPKGVYDDHGADKLYIGNGYHRFVAYGLWVLEHGFKPLRLYCVELPLTLTRTQLSEGSLDWR